MNDDDIKSGLWIALLVLAFLAFLMSTGLLQCSDANDRAIGSGTTANPVK